MLKKMSKTISRGAKQQDIERWFKHSPVIWNSWKNTSKIAENSMTAKCKHKILWDNQRCGKQMNTMNLCGKRNLKQRSQHTNLLSVIKIKKLLYHWKCSWRKWTAIWFIQIHIVKKKLERETVSYSKNKLPDKQELNNLYSCIFYNEISNLLKLINPTINKR